MLSRFKPLETPRLIIREWDEDDAKALYLLNADPEVLKYTGDGPFKDIHESRHFIRHYNHYALHGHGRWAVVLKETNQFIGWCGLRRLDDEGVDLGFRFYRKQWGQGYATEAAKKCLEDGFYRLQLPHIIGRVLPDNLASKRVLEKLGLSFWKKGPCDQMEGAAYYRLMCSDFKK